MLIDLFYHLRKSGVPVTIKELLILLEALQARLAFCSADEFYLLSRTCLIKDEKYFDRFDQAFGSYFKDLELIEDFADALIPEHWLTLTSCASSPKRKRQRSKRWVAWKPCSIP